MAAPYAFQGGSYPGTGGTCGATIAVGNCTIVVTYTPTSSGTHNDGVQLNYNDGYEDTTVSRDIAGVGLDPAVLAISDGSTYDFGSNVTNTISEKAFTVTNSGDVLAATVTGSGLAAFHFQGGNYPGIGRT